MLRLPRFIAELVDLALHGQLIGEHLLHHARLRQVCGEGLSLHAATATIITTECAMREWPTGDTLWLLHNLRIPGFDLSSLRGRKGKSF